MRLITDITVLPSVIRVRELPGNLMEKFGRRFAKLMNDSIKQTFELRGARGQNPQWAPNKPSYEAKKIAEVGAKPQLVFTGLLQEAATSFRLARVAGDTVFIQAKLPSNLMQLRKRGKALGNRKLVTYGQVHQNDIGRLRRFVFITDRDRINLHEIAAETLAEVIADAGGF